MFTRLLVPLDRSARDDAVLVVACGLARDAGAEVVLMHVEDTPTGLPAVVLANQYLERRVNELRAEGIAARSVVEYGRTSDEIEAAAEEQQADLIIMAPRHREWLDALRRPSVTARMLSRAAAPLLVWPEHVEAGEVLSSLAVPGAAVLVPLDGLELVERAIPFATRFAREMGRPLVLVHVVTPVTLVGAGPATARLELETQASALREARTYLGVMRKRLAKDAGLEVQSMVLRGQPGAELVRIAESHTGSVMVLSTHGRNGFARLMLGSVAAEVVRESPIPVFVISPRAWQGAEVVLASQPGQSAAEEPRA